MIDLYDTRLTSGGLTMNYNIIIFDSSNDINWSQSGDPVYSINELLWGQNG